MNFDQWRFYLRGMFFETLKKPQAAIEAYRRALAANPAFAQAASCLGFLHASRKEYGEAETYFVRALEIEPSADLWFNLGFAREHAGQRQAAVEAFGQAVKLDAKLDRAWYGMGLAYAGLGRHDEAAKALAEAAALQPMNGHAWYALGMAHHHCHRPDKVREVVEHIVRFDPRMARQLIREAERSDLAHLVRHLDD